MLTDKQKQELAMDLPADWIKSRKAGGGSVDYLDGYRVLEQANAIFEHEWSYEVIAGPEVVYQSPPDAKRFTRVYQAKVRVRVGDVVREDVGCDQVDADPGNGAAITSGIDKAVKGCVTDATKRALRTFGPRLGLALYDKNRSAVGASLEEQREEQREEQARQEQAPAPPQGPRVVQGTELVASAPTVNALTALWLSERTKMRDQREGWRVFCRRAVDLGSTEEEFNGSCDAAWKLSTDPAHWSILRAALFDLELLCITPHHITAWTKKHAGVARLPGAVKALAVSERTRRAGCAAVQLGKRLQEAPDAAARDAVAREVSPAFEADAITQADANSLSDLHARLSGAQTSRAA